MRLKMRNGMMNWPLKIKQYEGYYQQTPWRVDLSRSLSFLALGVLAAHFEKASRFALEALTPKPGVLVLDCQDRILRLGADDQGRRVILLPPGPLPEMVVAAFLAAEDALPAASRY